MATALPMIPTHVMGSHRFPGWFWTALDKIKAGEYGQTDVKEAFDDATQLAIRDQELLPCFGVGLILQACYGFPLYPVTHGIPG
jgi:hypothetical protein